LRPFNISVHIIEPGFFKTNLTDSERHANEVRQMWNQLPANTRQLYGGEEYVKKGIRCHLKTSAFNPMARVYVVTVLQRQ
jgi:hypothetical protein